MYLPFHEDSGTHTVHVFQKDVKPATNVGLALQVWRISRISDKFL